MTTDTPTVALSGYDALLVEFRPKPITSESQYRRVMKQIDGLMRLRKLSRSQEDLLELLSMLVVRYEERVVPSAAVSPGQLLAHLLEDRGVSRAELARQTGIARQTITNIVNSGRPVSRANRERLAEFFGVSPGLFVEAQNN